MKRLILITIIFLAAAACERHSAAEPSPSESKPSSGIHEKQPESLQWEMGTALGTIALVLVTGISIYVASRTEQVFKEIVATLGRNAEVLAQTQARVEDAAVVRTMATCIEQYQEIEDKRHAKAIDAERYFELLWNLHFAEFHFFKRGFLPAEVYGLWVWVRHQDYHKDRLKLEKTEAEGWSHAKEYLRDEDFQSFVESWLKKPNITRLEVTNLIMPLLHSTKVARKA